MGEIYLVYRITIYFVFIVVIILKVQYYVLLTPLPRSINIYSTYYIRLYLALLYKYRGGFQAILRRGRSSLSPREYYYYYTKYIIILIFKVFLSFFSFLFYTRYNTLQAYTSLYIFTYTYTYTPSLSKRITFAVAAG